MPQKTQTETSSILEDAYVVADRPAVEAFIEENRLHGLLMQARDSLDAAFGKGPVKKLTLAEDDEGIRTLDCMVLVQGDLEAARQALQSFDENWWLANSSHIAGKLNFDFELIRCRLTGASISV
jgi:hypothetical protein